MSISTPETDAEWSCFKGHTELLHDVKNLSRKLERERDEAREQYDQICSQTLIEINKVCDERDKLREALRDVLKVSEPTPVMTYQKMEDIASKALKDTAK
jgi:hypothetical protein